MDNIEEVWKTYPEFDFIEASNLGRVRTRDRYVSSKGGNKRLVKGRVLKQSLASSGYIQVAFGVNGKKITLLVHRIIATCFVPNPLDLPEINHIDCDSTNNVASNLEWCSHEYNIQYREKYGRVLDYPVIAVNLKTLDVLHFKSQIEASRQLRVSQWSVNDVVNGRLNQAGGYWFTENENEITKEKIQEIKSHMNFCGGATAINLGTFEVLCFETQLEAARQLGSSTGNIGDVLSGRYKKTHGYWFCYVDEHAIEKVREKFGDIVASKVEELIKHK